MIANPRIFKTYDIRGEWNKEWDGEFVYNIGVALARQLKPKTVAIGRDMRNSSDEILTQLSTALLEEGVNVKDIGLCGTELAYYASSFVDDIDLSIMITASHNLGKDNGLKITGKDGICLGMESGLESIKDFSLQNIPKTTNQQRGTFTKISLWEDYKNHVFKLANVDQSNFPRKRIVIDAGNGIGGYMFDKVLGNLKMDVVRVFWEPDGTFPNHTADPYQEKNTEFLKKKVVEERAEMGVAFDGDSDRIFFVDEMGRYLPGYYCAVLLIDYFLKNSQHPEKETICYDPRYYWAVKEIIAKYKAKAVPSRVGHTLIKLKMKEANSVFSAETCGHILYKENNFTESTMATLLVMLKIIAERGSLSMLAEPLFERYPHSGETNFIVDDVKKVMKKIEGAYSHGEINRLDGLGIDFTEWRFSIRSSNTQPLLRLNVEAQSRELIKEKVEELKNIVGGKIAEH